ncbi:MAG: dual specificity protein phosphatase family protein [Actinomycetota bacterium]
MSSGTPTIDSPTGPAAWHRFLCWAHARLIVTGDLHEDPTRAIRQLDEWVRAGVTHIVDVRCEWSDAELVADLAPDIQYIWVGVDDHLGEQPDEWYDRVIELLGDALDDPDAVILVHCHMGVNRGPSMAFRLLLEQGWDPIAALEAIREARPIANVAYAESAMRHFHRRNPGSAAERLDDLRRVRQWRHDWPLDVRTIVREIGRATR